MQTYSRYETRLQTVLDAGDSFDLESIGTKITLIFVKEYVPIAFGNILAIVQ